MDEKIADEPCREAANYLAHCGSLVALKAEEDFTQNIFHEWKDLGIASPLEQVLYAALHLARVILSLPLFDVQSIDEGSVCSGLSITPQQTIGKYRVDFLIEMYPLQKVPTGTAAARKKSVVVECDSQAWHERTEPERRYEKARDRELVRRGYEVFHFTGKEILDDPATVAAEVLAHVTDCLKDYIVSAIRDHEANL
jgi:very-short-patch-repair endonuclease